MSNTGKSIKPGWFISRIIGLRDWVDLRLPIMAAWKKHMSEYYAPKNFNIWYFFGVLSLVVLVIQLLTGIWLTMNYTPTAEGAFASVEYIMRDVDYGWMLRYLHSTGSSAFFFVVYVHMFRGLMYGSYQKPRELIWVIGMFIYLVLMIEGFFGYILPWGQMSYWGANVIVSLFGAIPVIGEDLLVWIRGDYLISGVTLNRFFALHVVALPIVLLGLVVLHLLALHEVGSNNPDGTDIKKRKGIDGIPLDGVPFHPYYTIYHDLPGIVLFLIVLCAVVFFAPEMGGYFLEVANFQEADSLKTPEHVPPVWYYTPFYSMLRAVTWPFFGIDAKFWGMLVMFSAIAFLFVLPWLDKSLVRSMRYKGWYSRIALLMFVASFIILGVLGTQAVSPAKTVLAQIMTVVYFLYFILMPLYTRVEKVAEPPQRVTGRWISIPQLIGSILLLVALIVLPLMLVSGSAQAASVDNLELEHIETNFRDKDSLQRGFKYYMNYCVSCHALGYARYERTADDLEIPHELVLDNLVFDDSLIGDLIENSISEEDARNWFGAAPPDLTLSGRVHTADWLYTYLKSFYNDPSRPLGTNNKTFPDVGMPNVLHELQGDVTCDNHGAGDPGQCELQYIEGTGAMSAEEFDIVIADLVNFLYYIGEPIRNRRQEIGIWVLIFLTVLYAFTALMGREFSRDYH
ncbi:MAG: cytochrome b N-terminal domain-containing protein [Pseudomonadota bacterium]|nr:cytochrome b N-terminal domain-containing protein [Pseudomonadota bacterium]MEC9299774.1 cytochrome b N-terminal domain-containing protein [Pseudomonadota bacterium]